MTEPYDLSDREVGILSILARSERPLTMREVSRSRLEGWDADGVNARALNRLVGGGLVERFGSNRARFGITPNGVLEAGKRSNEARKAFETGGLGPEGRVDNPTRSRGAARVVALFDAAKFGRQIEVEMHLRNTTFDQIGGAIGRSGAAVHHIVNGKQPSVETFLRLLRWLGKVQIDLDAFRADPAPVVEPKRDIT